MKTTIKKSIAGIITLTTIALVSGNAALAQDKGPGDVINDTDLAFIQAEPTGTTTTVEKSRPAGPGDLVTSGDHAFAARPYSETVGNRQAAAEKPQTAGIITAADYQFVTKGHVPDVFAVQDDLAESLAGNQAK